MSGSHANWWMDASCRWHQGAPPPDWWQARDGRWHTPAPDDSTEELTISPPVAGTDLAAGGRRANPWAIYRGWPRWARLAGPVVAVILAVGVLAAAATEGLRESDRETATGAATTATVPETTAPSTTGPAPTAASTLATPTTAPMPSTAAPAEPEPPPNAGPDVAAPPPPTSPDATSDGVHPGAPCSPEGATALSDDGMPMTCTMQKCHGAPYRDPRWRRAAC